MIKTQFLGCQFKSEVMLAVKIVMIGRMNHFKTTRETYEAHPSLKVMLSLFRWVVMIASSGNKFSSRFEDENERKLKGLIT